jgi:hypothetical protein
MFMQLAFSKAMCSFNFPSLVSYELANNGEEIMDFFRMFCMLWMSIVINVCPSSTILNVKNMALIVF